MQAIINRKIFNSLGSNKRQIYSNITEFVSCFVMIRIDEEWCGTSVCFFEWKMAIHSSLTIELQFLKRFLFYSQHVLRNMSQSVVEICSISDLVARHCGKICHSFLIGYQLAAGHHCYEKPNIILDKRLISSNQFDASGRAGHLRRLDPNILSHHSFVFPRTTLDDDTRKRISPDAQCSRLIWLSRQKKKINIISRSISHSHGKKNNHPLRPPNNTMGGEYKKPRK